MFDEIASDWANKRSKEWTPFIEIIRPKLNKWVLNYCNENGSPDIFIDLGSGSGRHSSFFMGFCKILIDLDESREMLKNNFTQSIKIQANMRFIPFRDNSFDGIFSIASFHHLRSSEERKNVIEEIIRIGKINALVSITVWRFYQKKFIKQFLNQFHRSFGDNMHDKIGDVVVPWTISQKGNVKRVKRFYHLFRVVEFNRLISKFNIIHKSTMGKGGKKDNFIFIGKIVK
ncbi:MAG: hypothetical protein DRO88_10000 [Promethearchaeia archaeon]|nr:MAG: hypothetical protein DRO88_10000 [Candidatus Lokiarchaeia archaeon]